MKIERNADGYVVAICRGVEVLSETGENEVAVCGCRFVTWQLELLDQVLQHFGPGHLEAMTKARELAGQDDTNALRRALRRWLVTGTLATSDKPD